MNIRMDLIDIMIVKEVRRTERNCISSERRIWIFGDYFSEHRALLAVCVALLRLLDAASLGCHFVKGPRRGGEECEIKVAGLCSLMWSGTYINLDFIFILFEIYFLPLRQE